MLIKHSFFGLLIAGSSILLGNGCTQNTADTFSVRIGYFPNLTHATALVGIKNATFHQYLGNEITIDTKTFNTGTEEMEAILAEEIDIAYIGPSPALNGYIQSKGQAIQLIAGSTANGVTIVGTPDLAKDFQELGPEAFRGKRIASPSHGNTQDVALRVYLAEHNLTDAVEVLPLGNADQLTAFSQGEIDGAWSPEPWASRLIQEAGAELLFTEDTLWPNNIFATTLVLVRTEFLEQHPDVVRNWLKAHIAVTEWIQQHPQEAQVVVNTALEKLTTKKLDTDVLNTAWQRMIVTTDPIKNSVIESATQSEQLGFITIGELDLNKMFNTQILDEITAQ